MKTLKDSVEPWVHAGFHIEEIGHILWEYTKKIITYEVSIRCISNIMLLIS